MAQELHEKLHGNKETRGYSSNADAGNTQNEKRIPVRVHLRVFVIGCMLWDVEVQCPEGSLSKGQLVWWEEAREGFTGLRTFHREKEVG